MSQKIETFLFVFTVSMLLLILGGILLLCALSD